MEEQRSIKKIDIEEAIRSKNPKLYKRLPRFVLNYIKRVTHEKDINDFLKIHGEKHDFEFLEAVISYFEIKINIIGEENMRMSGGIIYASNHPIGSMDGMALMLVLGRHRPDLKFIVNDLLMQVKNLQGLFVGVNKHSKTATGFAKELDELYASDKVVLVFPAGLVSRKQKGVVRDLEWKKSFISKAKRYKRDIIPIYTHGKNSKKFYNLGVWRKRLGIKANVEMFFLIDEMFRQRGKTLTFVFDKPIPYTHFDKKHTDLEWAQILKKQVYDLEKNIK
jgi:1-acyl-sn-glycerol-3-phosphate acyltransferase